ncbi:MAG: nucleotidyltransferase family protein [Gemmatimonadetes bacterium]|nr:nucleotidyltransferase family protein [Gemmatimonadota bacterium]
MRRPVRARAPRRGAGTHRRDISRDIPDREIGGTAVIGPDRGPVSSGTVAGVILAAGSSTRMGTPKALLDAGGATFAARLVDTLARGGCASVVVVAGSGAGPVAEEVARIPARLVVNTDGRGGQLGSLRAALAELGTAGDPPAAIVFTPVDNPAVAPGTVAALIGAWRRGHAAIVAPEYRGKRGHPVLVDMTIAPEFLEAGLPEGARTVVRRDPARVLQVPVDDPAILDDLDTPDRYGERFPRRGATGRNTPAAR